MSKISTTVIKFKEKQKSRIKGRECPDVLIASPSAVECPAITLVLYFALYARFILRNIYDCRH